MYRVIKGRGTGKTKELMLFAQKNDAIFCCSNPYGMSIKAEAYGIYGLRFEAYDYILNSDADSDKFIVIDEIESYIKYTIQSTAKFIGYTLSLED